MDHASLPSVPPVSDDDYAQARDYVDTHRSDWEGDLRAGLTTIAGHLAGGGYRLVQAAEHLGLAAGNEPLEQATVLAAARFKTTAAIVAKMRRFGEPLKAMLDMWGYRLVVADEPALDRVAELCLGLWDTPAPDEMLLRSGELAFASWRDYRRRDHAGLSAATTDRYDQAVHLNRRAPFGIVEIQVLSWDLYRRVHCDPSSPDSHDTFVTRREAILRRQP
jgi:hypothetical protein